MRQVLRYATSLNRTPTQLVEKCCHCAHVAQELFGLIRFFGHSFSARQAFGFPSRGKIILLGIFFLSFLADGVHSTLTFFSGFTPLYPPSNLSASSPVFSWALPGKPGFYLFGSRPYGKPNTCPNPHKLEAIYSPAAALCSNRGFGSCRSPDSLCSCGSPFHHYNFYHFDHALLPYCVHPI